MGWNACALFVRSSDPPASLQALGRESPAVETVDAATATSSSRGDGTFYAAAAHGWYQIWDPCGTAVERFLDLGPEDALRNQDDTLAVVFGSVSSVHAFALYRRGVLVRRVIYADAEAVVDEGTPLAIEGRIEIPEWGPDEDFIWAVIKGVTGIEYDDDLRFVALTSPFEPS